MAPVAATAGANWLAGWYLPGTWFSLAGRAARRRAPVRFLLLAGVAASEYRLLTVQFPLNQLTSVGCATRRAKHAPEHFTGSALLVTRC